MSKYDISPSEFLREYPTQYRLLRCERGIRTLINYREMSIREKGTVYIDGKIIKDALEDVEYCSEPNPHSK